MAMVVLILVVVEDGLGAREGSLLPECNQVLILVVVEDGLGEVTYLLEAVLIAIVLILVVVEDGLGDCECYTERQEDYSS